MAVTLPLFMLLVIFWITAHAELSGPSQGEKCVSDDSKQIYVGVLVKLMYSFIGGWGRGGRVEGSRCFSPLISVSLKAYAMSHNGRNVQQTRREKVLV